MNIHPNIRVMIDEELACLLIQSTNKMKYIKSSIVEVDREFKKLQEFMNDPGKDTKETFFSLMRLSRQVEDLNQNVANLTIPFTSYRSKKKLLEILGYWDEEEKKNE